jgi:hypothetical protein
MGRLKKSGPRGEGQEGWMDGVIMVEQWSSSGRAVVSGLSQSGNSSASPAAVAEG